MKAKQWKKKIVEASKAAGTYQPYFDLVINTLADILEKRDDCQDQFVQLGGAPIIAYTNKGGATNPTRNPALLMVDELNKSALQYWRDLGLTPAGLKRINEEALKPKQKKSTFAEVLSELGEELS